VKPLQIVRCLFGRHRHSRRVSLDEAGVARSRCAGCGRRMMRVEEGRHRAWRLENKRRD